MRRQIIVTALAAIAGWTFVPTEANAFGHHRRRANHNACCTPQPVQCCQSSMQYQSEPIPYAQPAPVSSCCGGSVMDGGYGQPMYGQMPPQPMPQGTYPNGGMNYQGQGAYNQGYGQPMNGQQGFGQASGNVNAEQQGVGANASGNVGGAGANVGGGVNAGAGANGGGAGNVNGGANVGGNVGGAAANAGANVGAAAGAAGL